MGTSVIIGLITLMMFYGVPISKKESEYFNKIFLGGILVVVLVFITTGGKILQSYQLDRLNFLDPCERYQDKTGYQLCNGFYCFF